jgi:DNA adenine methylase
MKPLLKWAGGKRHIARQLEAFFPPDWDSGTYIEPFIGGGAMYLHLQPRNSLIADVNKRLVGFYTHVQKNVEDVFGGISEIAKEFESIPLKDKKDLYLNFRTRFNGTDAKTLDSAILLYSLNKLCFNGLYRENSKGAFNVPFGQKKNFPPLIKDDFEGVSGLLKGTEIASSDFEETIARAKTGDFVYLDPPYVPLDITASFTSYHSEGFGITDQQRLAKAMLELRKLGINAMCSNSDTPLTREIYGQLNLATIQAPRMVSAKASGRGSVSELVITNY